MNQRKQSTVVLTYPKGSTRVAYAGNDVGRARQVYAAHQSRALAGKLRVTRIDLTVAGRWAATQTIPDGWGRRRRSRAA
jgi:hypothetical protein